MVMNNRVLHIGYIGATLLLCISAFLVGCHSNAKVSETASATSTNYRTKEPSAAITEAITETTPDATMLESTDNITPTTKDNITAASTNVISDKISDKDDFTSTSAEVAGDIVSSSDTPKERIAEELTKDIDGNGIMDVVQTIARNDDSELFIRIFINGEQIFEYKDPNNFRIMGVFLFEYLDLDGDDANEIFITTNTDANSRPLTLVLCLKQAEGQWKLMDIPRNEIGNNGFPFKITRGKKEFDFIISSDAIDQDIHFDATNYFKDDESGNIDSIQAYRSNKYKVGDEVGFISAWGIWEASTGTYKGRNCIIAVQGIEGPYGHGLGHLSIYYSYNEDGAVEILNVEYQP